MRGECGTWVTFPEELHPHDGEDEDDDTEDEGEVTKSTNSFPHDGDEKVEGGPGLGKFKYSQLQRYKSTFNTIQLLLLLLCSPLQYTTSITTVSSTYQSKRSKDGKTGDIVQAEL